MKFSLLIFLVTVNVWSFGQKKEAYYDFFWKPCSPENSRYYSIKEKTDSGWLQNDYYTHSRSLQMKALYEDKACTIQNGYGYYFHANGLASVIGRRIHGKQDGICVSYYSNGMIADSAIFQNGAVTDKRFRWHRNGYLSDSISRLNDSVYVHVGWFDDGEPAFAGHELNDKRNGKWVFYHHNGQLSSSAVYRKGNIISIEYFDEAGKTQTDTSAVNREAVLKGGEVAWRKYLEKNLYWPPGLKFTTPAAVTVGIGFAIDENGKVIDAEVFMPFHEEFDRIALKIIKNSPAWLPAIEYNRKVKAYRRQPITFTQSDE
jgi:antitoxin component YwqK of YwqJK toxin-antitoxin module